LIFNGKKIMDLTGRRSGRLVAIRPIDRKSKDKVTFWECRCDCGRISIQRATRIARGIRKSCGCLSGKTLNGTRRIAREDRAGDREKCGKVPLWYFHGLEYGAKKRGIRFEVSVEYVSDLYERQCGKCIFSGRTLTFACGTKAYKKTTASLDRIVSSQGYVKGNVQWIHKVLNKMKKNWSDDRFIRQCVDTWEIIRDVAMKRG